MHVADRFRTQVLSAVTSRYPGKEELVELVALALCSRDHLLVIGPPGTAKSEVVHEMALRLSGRYFDYLLSRFTEPSELFGPVDIAGLRDGVYRTRTEGMLPEAEVVFLDEIFHANSAILNTLLGILQNGRFRRGGELRSCPLISAIAASNELAEDSDLRALQDRFTLRVLSEPLADEKLPTLLEAGWSLERERLTDSRSTPNAADATFTTDELRSVHRLVAGVDLTPVREHAADLLGRIRACGVPVSDRRAVRFLRLVAASATLCKRSSAGVADLWPARYLWEIEDERDSLAELVEEFVIDRASATAREDDHPLARLGLGPTALLEDLSRLESEVDDIAAAIPRATADRLQVRIQALDRQRRWCRSENPDDASKLKELEDRLGSVYDVLAQKTTRNS
ncbi:MAG: AAA family ATPase [Planctomycetota bacterium]